MNRVTFSPWYRLWFNALCADATEVNGELTVPDPLGPVAAR